MNKRQVAEINAKLDAADELVAQVQRAGLELVAQHQLAINLLRRVVADDDTQGVVLTSTRKACREFLASLDPPAQPPPPR